MRLGGEMAAAIDETGIQFRQLNTRKGPAVRASRAQADKLLYRQRMKHRVERADRLTVYQGSVVGLVLEDRAHARCRDADGRNHRRPPGRPDHGNLSERLIHVGTAEAKRRGEPETSRPADSANSWRDLGFRIGRLKTGTCPRLDGRTHRLRSTRSTARRRSTGSVFLFDASESRSLRFPAILPTQPANTHEIVRSGLDRSPMFSGVIKGRGPRYCPSIEDKVVRFADKDRHQVFLEPEGRETVEVYPNGLSTSLPLDVQASNGPVDPRAGGGGDHAARIRHRV